MLASIEELGRLSSPRRLRPGDFGVWSRAGGLLGGDGWQVRGPSCSCGRPREGR